MERIYLLDPETDQLEPLEPERDLEEAALQDLVARHPELLVGGLPDTEGWVMIDREAGVPAEQEGANRWAVDHLFVDDDAIPTFIEVKRRSDSRVRRQVVGQVLEYGANGSAYWDADDLREAFADGLPEEADGDEVLVERLGGGVDPDAFWQRIERNLRNGDVRLIVAADEVPRELRRIVEFLNGQMGKTEVLAVEIRQFTSDSDRRTLVPTVYGQTAAAEDAKGRSADLGQRFEDASQTVRDLRERLRNWVEAEDLRFDRVPSQLRIQTGNGLGGVALVPRLEIVGVHVGSITDAGFEAEADELLSDLEDFANADLSTRAVRVPADKVLERFDHFTEHFIQRYWQLRRQAGHTEETVYG